MVPNTVHTPSVPELNVTVRPESEEALTMIGIWSDRLSARAAKVIV